MSEQVDSVEWDDIVVQAGGIAAALVPGVPGLVIGIATGIAKAIFDGGCAVRNCPADVELKGPLPDVAREFRDAEQAARDRVRESQR